MTVGVVRSCDAPSPAPVASVVDGGGSPTPGLPGCGEEGSPLAGAGSSAVGGGCGARAWGGRFWLLGADAEVGAEEESDGEGGPQGGAASPGRGAAANEGVAVTRRTAAGPNRVAMGAGGGSLREKETRGAETGRSMEGRRVEADGANKHQGWMPDLEYSEGGGKSTYGNWIEIEPSSGRRTAAEARRREEEGGGRSRGMRWGGGTGRERWEVAGGRCTAPEELRRRDPRRSTGRRPWRRRRGPSRAAAEVAPAGAAATEGRRAPAGWRRSAPGGGDADGRPRGPGRAAAAGTRAMDRWRRRIRGGRRLDVSDGARGAKLGLGWNSSDLEYSEGGGKSTYGNWIEIEPSSGRRTAAEARRREEEGGGRSRGMRWGGGAGRERWEVAGGRRTAPEELRRRDPRRSTGRRPWRRRRGPSRAAAEVAPAGAAATEGRRAGGVAAEPAGGEARRAAAALGGRRRRGGRAAARAWVGRA
nr:collagen alpha-2(I) chain-like [Aegilops tauschii subsp. strangulata]